MTRAAEGFLTIFCISNDLNVAREFISSQENWLVESLNESQFNANTPFGDLKISATYPEVGGGKFRQVLMGTLNAVRKIPESSQFKQEDLNNQLLDSTMILGCVAKPDFGDASDIRFKVLSGLAKNLSGISFFDGFVFLNGDGELIVTLDGKTTI